MDKQQEVQKICQELFEDTVKHACRLDCEPSNQYIAAMRKGVQWFAAQVTDPRIFTVIWMSNFPEEYFQIQLNSTPKPITCWNHVVLVFLHLHVFSRSLSARPDFDAERVISFTNEHCLQPVLNMLLPWIVLQEGGWEDFGQFTSGTGNPVQ